MEGHFTPPMNRHYESYGTNLEISLQIFPYFPFTDFAFRVVLCVVCKIQSNLCKLSICWNMYHSIRNAIVSCFLQKMEIWQIADFNWFIFHFWVYPFLLFINLIPCKHHFSSRVFMLWSNLLMFLYSSALYKSTCIFFPLPIIHKYLLFF